MKNKKLKKNAIMFFLIFIIIIVSITVICLINNKDGDNKIIATKTITTQDGQTQTIKYTIAVENYEIESTIKEIVFETEEEAQLECNRYEIINKFERKEIGLELKKKKLILTMPEQQLKLDVGYEEYKNIRLISETGEEKEIVNEDELKQCLIEQGYEIK